MDISRDSKTDNGKQKALETTLANLNKKYGDGSVMKLGRGNTFGSRVDRHR